MDVVAKPNQMDSNKSMTNNGGGGSLGSGGSGGMYGIFLRELYKFIKGFKVTDSKIP